MVSHLFFYQLVLLGLLAKRLPCTGSQDIHSSPGALQALPRPQTLYESHPQAPL